MSLSFKLIVAAWLAGSMAQISAQSHLKEHRVLIPERGVSLLDAPGKPFHDPAADAAFFKALEATVRQTDRRRIIRLPYDLNDPAFAVALVKTFLELIDRNGR